MCCSYPCQYENTWANNEQWLKSSSAVSINFILQLSISWKMFLKYWWLILHSGVHINFASNKILSQIFPPSYKCCQLSTVTRDRAPAVESSSNMYGLTLKPSGSSSSLSSLSESLKSAGFGDGCGEKSPTAERRLLWLFSTITLLAAVKFKFHERRNAHSALTYKINNHSIACYI